MGKVLRVEVRDVYGRELIYPREPEDVASAVRYLTGKETIDARDITRLEILGFDIEVMPRALKGGA
jgi:hypothetical protein